jgi:hypothetical protein
MATTDYQNNKNNWFNGVKGRKQDCKQRNMKLRDLKSSYSPFFLHCLIFTNSNTPILMPRVMS